MSSVSCTDYYLRLNTELNHYDSINVILSDILSRDSLSRISLEMLQDFVQIYINSVQREMKEIASDLANEGIEVGLTVSPKTTKGE